MMNEGMIRQFTKMIIPFKYDVKADNRLTELCDGALLWKKCGFDGCELREGVRGMLSSIDSNEKIAECYEFNENCRTSVRLPGKYNWINVSLRAGKNVTVQLNAIKLFLFETGIGFLEFHYKYGKLDINDCIDANYYLAEIGNESNKLEYQNKKSGKSTISLRDLVLKMIAYVPTYECFDIAEKHDLCKKALIYSYALFDSPQDELLKNSAFNIRKNYNLAYKPNKTENDVGNKEYIFEPFENSMWLFSENGAVNFSHFVEDDEKTNIFFKDAFLKRVLNHYYALFLIASHQKFVIKSLMEETKNINVNEIDYKKMLIQQDLAEKLFHRYERISFRCFCDFPSINDHVNKYFAYIKKAFDIAEFEKCLNKDIDKIKSISNRNATIVTNINAKDKEKKKCVKDTIIFVFGLLISLSGVLEAVLKFIDVENTILRIKVAVGLSAIAILCLGIFCIIKCVIGRRKLEKEKEEEKAKLIWN